MIFKRDEPCEANLETMAAQHSFATLANPELVRRFAVGGHCCIWPVAHWLADAPAVFWNRPGIEGCTDGHQ